MRAPFVLLTALAALTLSPTSPAASLPPVASCEWHSDVEDLGDALPLVYFREEPCSVWLEFCTEDAVPRCTRPWSESIDPPQCYWEQGFADAVYHGTGGIVHPHDGSPWCTVHIHIPSRSADCAWNPDFADLIYSASQGTLHPHDGGMCSIHPHLP